MKTIIEWLGQVQYDLAWEWQNGLVTERTDNPDLDGKILLLEHPPTYTLGRNGRLENLLWNEATLAEKGFTIHHTDRGGDITYHGPGQLVAYPILNLYHVYKRFGLSRIALYVRDLEEIVIQTLANYGINGLRYKGNRGVWVETANGLSKIAAIGVRVNRKGITSHGFALNVTTNLAHFDGIIPCGIQDHGVTSMEAILGNTIPLTDLIPHLSDAFSTVLGVEK
ncbi:MAG: lipoyl(octanoyl) transferase LipB, partial [Chloroflexi bacterium]|nr:lipoyl(octanoyl) transferase LipB [Chloroflexota bacterium]